MKVGKKVMSKLYIYIYITWPILKCCFCKQFKQILQNKYLKQNIIQYKNLMKPVFIFLQFLPYTLFQQLTVIAFDSQIRHMATTATLSIQVSRNANAPRFSERPYARNMEWRNLPGTLAVTILATDDDQVCQQKYKIMWCFKIMFL